MKLGKTFNLDILFYLIFVIVIVFYLVTGLYKYNQIKINENNAMKASQKITQVVNTLKKEHKSFTEMRKNLNDDEFIKEMRNYFDIASIGYKRLGEYTFKGFYTTDGMFYCLNALHGFTFVDTNGDAKPNIISQSIYPCKDIVVITSFSNIINQKRTKPNFNTKENWLPTTGKLFSQIINQKSTLKRKESNGKI
ncbi:MAG: hypothetical protein PHV37_04545 [Candidatus Gastranaerophilales bacterium]|nr:hypothetical protein [Candidatus Gastranaerophilales bacterium]